MSAWIIPEKKDRKGFETELQQKVMKIDQTVSELLYWVVLLLLILGFLNFRFPQLIYALPAKN